LTFAQPPLGCFDGRCASRWRSLQAESGTRVRRINAARASSCQLVYVEAEDTASDGEPTCLERPRRQLHPQILFSGPEVQAAVQGHAIVTPTGQIRIGAVLRLRLFPW
jgi:hypothetical protein